MKELRSILSISYFVAVTLMAAPLLGAAGAEEEASSARGVYVAEQVRIISPAEVDIDAYIASIDYDYPDPVGDLGITLYSEHRQVSIRGQEEIMDFLETWESPGQ